MDLIKGIKIFKGIKIRSKDNHCSKAFLRGNNFILQLVLFIIFLIFFGIPSVEKYLKKQTIVISSQEQTNGIEAPSITFVARKRKGVAMGWKSVDRHLNFASFAMVQHCQKMNFTDINVCQKNDTFGRDEFLKSARLGFYKENSTSLFKESSSSMWTEDLTLTYDGRHFTLNPAMKITVAPHHALLFKVNTSLDYYILIFSWCFFYI